MTSTKDIKDLVDKTAKWAASPEGQEALKKSKAKLEITLEKLKQEREASDEVLHMPLCPNQPKTY